MEKDIKDLKESIDLIAKTTATILETVSTMTTKEQLNEFKLETQKNFDDIRNDFKSFKQETSENYIEINKEIADLSDTSINYDKRIEKLENKVFA